MTNTTTVAASPAPQRQAPVGLGKAGKDHPSNAPSFATVMRAERAGQAEQANARNTDLGEVVTLRGSADPETGSGVNSPDADSNKTQDSKHLPGLSALHRRDWHAFRATASEQQDPTEDGGTAPKKGETRPRGIAAQTTPRERAANSNMLAESTTMEFQPEPLEELSKVRPVEHTKDGKPQKIHSAEKKSQSDDTSAAGNLAITGQALMAPAPTRDVRSRGFASTTQDAEAIQSSGSSADEAVAAPKADAGPASLASAAEPKPTASAKPEAELGAPLSVAEPKAMPAARPEAGSASHATTPEPKPTPATKPEAESATPSSVTEVKTMPAVRPDAGPASHASTSEPKPIEATRPKAEFATPSSAAEPKTMQPVKPDAGLARSPGVATQPATILRATPIAPQASVEKPAQTAKAPLAPVSAGPSINPAPSAASPAFTVEMTVAAANHAKAPPAPVSAGPSINATPSAASPAFTVEMTVAAANYALASSKSAIGLEPGSVDDTETKTAVPMSEPARVTIVPSRSQATSPTLAAGALSMPVALIADDQARQTATKAGELERTATLDMDTASAHRPKAEAATAVPTRVTSGEIPPMQQGQTSPTATVVAAIAAEPSARPQQVATHSLLQSAQLNPEPKTLTIQLHPGELGVVYAKFQMRDGQMSVEISAETQEARARLSAESHTIAKSLRTMGIEVEQVTVMQTAPATPAHVRIDDATPQNLPSGRDQQSSSGAQTSGQGGGGNLGGQQNGRNGHDMANAGRDQSSTADRGSNGVYI